jgi:multiple sugar transport system permease protein
MADKLGLLNSPNAIILPGIFAAFGVFMLRQFMLDIPYAYIEAAKMDGAGHLQIFYKIMIPMIKPGLAALIILLFVDYWNMVEQPLIFLDDPFKQPLSVYLSRINGEKGIAFAASMLYMAPMVLLFLYAETYFIEGIQLSGIKG